MADQSLLLLVQQLQSELQSQRQELQIQHQDLQALRAEVTQLRLYRSSLLPDPPRFDGKPFSLRTWLPSIRAKLRSSQLHGADAFDYIWDRLEQPQQASVLHLRQSAESSQSWDPEVLFLYFQRLCHNPREQQEAISRYTSVRQRDDESLIAFLARFERLTHEADAASWPDAARVSTLHRGLRAALRTVVEESHDSCFQLLYDEYVELVQRHDRRTRAPRPPQAPVKKEQHRAEDMEVDTTQPRANVARFAPPSPPTSISDRRAHRLGHGLCFCCGSGDHWINDCPRSRSRSLSDSDSRPRPRPRPRSSASSTTSQHPTDVACRSTRTKTTAQRRVMSVSSLEGGGSSVGG